MKNTASPQEQAVFLIGELCRAYQKARWACTPVALTVLVSR